MRRVMEIRQNLLQTSRASTKSIIRPGTRRFRVLCSQDHCQRAVPLSSDRGIERPGKGVDGLMGVGGVVDKGKYHGRTPYMCPEVCSARGSKVLRLSLLRYKMVIPQTAPVA